MIKEPGTDINFAPAVTPASAFYTVLTNLREQEGAEVSTINFAPAVTPASAFYTVLTNLREQEESRESELVMVSELIGQS